MLEFRGKLSDAELENVLAAALRDVALMEIVDQIVANARAIYEGTEEEKRHLHDKLWHECRRIALALYPSSLPSDWNELHMQVRADFIKRWLSDIPYLNR
jgi:hypothetical protein